jgi:hypothetical protein
MSWWRLVGNSGAWAWWVGNDVSLKSSAMEDARESGCRNSLSFLMKSSLEAFENKAL